MHDAIGMRGSQRFGQGDRDRQQIIDGQAAGLHPLLQALALDVLHDEERLAVGLLHRMHGHHIGVIDGGE